MVDEIACHSLRTLYQSASTPRIAQGEKWTELLHAVEAQHQIVEHTRHMAANATHALFLDQAGTVYSCGDNTHGACGQGSSRTLLFTFTAIPALLSIRTITG